MPPMEPSIELEREGPENGGNVELSTRCVYFGHYTVCIVRFTDVECS